MKKRIALTLITLLPLITLASNPRIRNTNPVYLFYSASSLYLPNEDCGLTNAELHLIIDLNPTDSIPAGDSIAIHYTVTNPLGGVANYTIGERFGLTQKADLNRQVNSVDFSMNGTYTIFCEIEYVDGTLNLGPTDDTLTTYVTNYVANTPGDIVGDVQVCMVDPIQLDLSGAYWTTVRWVYSLDAGSSWDTLGIQDVDNMLIGPDSMNTNFWVYARMTNGTCPAYLNTDTSTFSVFDSATVSGTLSGDTNVCILGNSGNLTLSGETGTIGPWWYTTDSGATWNSIANVTNVESYTNLTNTTWYRVEVTRGVCDSAYSNNGIVTIDDTTIVGTVTGVGTICPTTVDTINITGNRGTVQEWYWQIASAGSFTTEVAPTIPYVGTDYMNAAGYNFKALVKNGDCPADTTPIGYLINTFDLPSIGGHLTSDVSTVCEDGSSSITIQNDGGRGILLNWLASLDSGLTWNVIDSGDTMITVTGTTSTSLFCVETKNGGCPATYSDTLLVLADSLSQAGSLLGDSTGCARDNSGKIRYVSKTGDGYDWIYSIDYGISWTSLGVAADIYSYTTLMDTTFFRGIVKNGTCPVDTSSDVVAINIWPLPPTYAGADTTFSLGDTAYINDAVSNLGVSFEWSPEESIEDNTLLNPLFFPKITTTYTLRSTDARGCVGIDDVIITINEVLDYTLTPSNLVTANNDGFNDYWYVENIQYYETSMVSIYDQEGNEVYKRENYLNDWRPGSTDDTKLQEGTYYYFIRFSDSDVEYKGSIVIKNVEN